MHNINLGICVGWSETIPNEIINNIELGCIGFHPTMLPKNRGKHPIIWSIFLGLKYTGSTFFLMNQNIDSGEILDQKLIKISKYENSQSLYSKIQTKAVFQIKKVLIDLKKKRFNTFKQSNNLANYWRKRKEIDGHIDWRMNFVTIDRLVRSLHKPYPGAFYIYKNNKIPVWKIKKSPKKNTSNIEPGKVITNNNDDVMVKCYDCFLWIIEHDFKEIPKSGEYLL